MESSVEMVPLIRIIETIAPETPDPTDNRLPLAETALRVYLSPGLNANTRAARTSDFADFCAFQVAEPDGAAVAGLLSMSAGELRTMISDYLADLRKRKLSDATINRRLISVRMLLATCRHVGADLPDAKSLVQGVKVRSYRDTKGPGSDAVAQLLDGVKRDDLKGKRDYAMLCLLYLSALRRGEVMNLDAGDLDLRRKRIRILGKGRGTQYEWLSVPPETVDALRDYLDARGTLVKLAPLFVSLSRSVTSGTRLTGHGIYKIVTGRAWSILGEHVRPHALRHTAITEALDETGGDVRRVQSFSRHAQLETLKHYDDARQDHHGEIANVVAASMRKKRMSQ